MTRVIINRVLALAVFAAFLLPNSSFGALGISPPFMNADHLVKGARYQQTIYIVQDKPDDDLRMQAKLDIADSVRSWVDIDKGFEFVIPKGTRQFPVVVTIKVPENAPLGVYSGNLSFLSMPSQAGQVTIALSVQAAINLTVGTGIYRDFKVMQMRALDVEEGWAPRAHIKVTNNGNVSESFDGATFELYDKFNAVRLAYIQKTEDFPEIPPFTSDEYTVEFPTDFHLGIGQYWGTVTMYKESKIIATEKSVFNVLEAGSISGTSAMVIRHFKGNWGYYAFGIFSTLLVAVGWKKRRKAV